MGWSSLLLLNGFPIYIIRFVKHVLNASEQNKDNTMVSNGVMSVDIGSVDQQLSLLLSLILAITIVLILVKFVYWWIFLLVSLCLLIASWIVCKVVLACMKESLSVVDEVRPPVEQRYYLTCTHCERYPAVIRRIIDGKETTIEPTLMSSNCSKGLSTQTQVRRTGYGAGWRVYR